MALNQVPQLGVHLLRHPMSAEVLNSLEEEKETEKDAKEQEQEKEEKEQTWYSSSKLVYILVAFCIATTAFCSLSQLLSWNILLEMFSS